MKPIIVYYSRTGTTKIVGDYLAEKLNCPTIELIDLTKRIGPLAYIFGGKDAMQRKLTQIEKVKENVFEYDLVIIGTPVWGSNITPAVRTFLTLNPAKKVAFFCTAGGNNVGLTFHEMEKLTATPKATLALTTFEVRNNKFKEKVEEFAKKLI
jgi:flavodoxin